MKILSNEKEKCCVCNGNHLDYEAINLEGDMAYFKWKCNDCGAKGAEWYEMKFAGHNVENENGDLIEIQNIGEEI